MNLQKNKPFQSFAISNSDNVGRAGFDRTLVRAWIALSRVFLSGESEVSESSNVLIKIIPDEARNFPIGSSPDSATCGGAMALLKTLGRRS